jgi:MFS family permease
MAVASAVSTIVAGDRLGARWGAVPNTAGIVGTGIGALALTALMARHGRRFGLTFGYLASTCGAAVAAAGVAAGDVIALGAGMLLLGLGNAGAQLSRYAAADLYPPERRGFAISTVVWAGAIGAVGGPLLLGPSNDAATALGQPSLTGPYALAALATLGAAAAITTIRLSPSGRSVDTVVDAPNGVPVGAGAGTSMRGTGTVVAGRYGAGPAGDRVRLREVVRTSGARTAFGVMATAQVVMVAVMTAAPLDMTCTARGWMPWV